MKFNTETAVKSQLFWPLTLYTVLIFIIIYIVLISIIMYAVLIFIS